MRVLFFLLLAQIGLAQCPDYVEAFIKDSRIYADSVEAFCGVPSDFIIVVAMYESGYGQSNLARTQNNYFGIKDPTTGGWATYNNKWESFAHFGLLLSRLKRYQVLRTIPKDKIHAWFFGLQLCGYNSSNDYGFTLGKIYQLWEKYL